MSHEGSPHEQLGVNFEVASVIKEFTEPVVGDEDLHFEENTKGDDVSAIHCYYFSSFFMNLKSIASYTEVLQIS